MTKVAVQSIWQAADCPCGSEQLPLEVFATGLRRYVCCPDCGLVFVSPRRAEEAVKAFYREDYDQAYGQAEAGADRAPVFRSLFRHLARFRRPPGRMLDVGCGDGRFLTLCMNDGWTAFGVELSREAAARATACGITMLPDDWLDRRPRSGALSESYDVIALINVLETVVDPLTVLRRVRGALSRDGVLLLRVGNGAFHLSLRRLFWKTGARYLQAFHLFVYRPESLTALLERAGLQTISLRNSSPSWAPLRGAHHLVRRWMWRLGGIVAWRMAQVLFVVSGGRILLAPSFEVIARVKGKP